MPQRFEPKFSILPAAQREIWPSLPPAQQLGFVLYDGTAVALHLGHRESLDFDFSDPNRWTRIKYARRSDLLAAPQYCKTCRTRWWCWPKCHLAS
jgi:hypothetical protein